MACVPKNLPKQQQSNTHIHTTTSQTNPETQRIWIQSNTYRYTQTNTYYKLALWELYLHFVFITVIHGKLAATNCRFGQIEKCNLANSGDAYYRSVILHKHIFQIVFIIYIYTHRPLLVRGQQAARQVKT